MHFTCYKLEKLLNKNSCKDLARFYLFFFVWLGKILQDKIYLASSCEQDFTRSGKILLYYKTRSTRPNRVSNILNNLSKSSLSNLGTQDCARFLSDLTITLSC